MGEEFDTSGHGLRQSGCPHYAPPESGSQVASGVHIPFSGSG
jgi:hypothetical protein